MYNISEKARDNKTALDIAWEKAFDGKKFAFLSPYQCPFGQPRKDIVNGCTGFPTLFGGADFYWFPDLKDVEDVKFLSKYDGMFINVYPEYFHLVKKIKEQCPELKIYGITDIQTHVLAWWSLADIRLFIDSIRLYDIIMCTNMDEVQTFAGCLEDPSRCLYTGWPMYNEITHYKRIIEPKDKDPNYISLGINNPGEFSRDILTNLAVYKKLKRRFPELKAFMYYMTPNKKENTQKIIESYGVTDYELVDELPYDKALDQLSKASLAIHMYTFKVVGRLAQDCASLGIPTVGTIANFPNRWCFPETSVNDYYVNDAVEIATQLLTNPYFYYNVRKHAIDTSHIWSIDSTRERILPLLPHVGIQM